MTDIAKSIKAINQQAEFYITNENIDTIQWKNGTTPIAKQTILNKQKELQAEYKAKQYQRDRLSIYPSIADQLDMLYWDKVNNTNNWESAIQEVKNKYPKP